MPVKFRPVACRAILGLSAVLASTMLALDADAAPIVTEGYYDAATISGAVRYRNFSNLPGSEIRVGDGLNANRNVTNPVEGQIFWGPLPVTMPIKITYGSSILRTEVGTAPVIVQKIINPPPSLLNYLEIRIMKNQIFPAVNLSNVYLDGQPLGSFSRPTDTIGTKLWNVTGVNLVNGFSLTGSLNFSDPRHPASPNYGFMSVDGSSVQVAMGSVIALDSETPVVSDLAVSPDMILLNSQATVTATVDDSDTGANAIHSAEYSLDGNAWVSMNSADGGFDEVSEVVAASFPATSVGMHQACVRGTDMANNTSDGDTCQDFLVDYKFDGFFSPIDARPAINIAKAGQAVPIKWRLTDANGIAIDNPASFTESNGGLYSYQVNCQDFEVQTGDAIEEYASGSSGLQYNGDGNWQFNWKTPKTYANTCRVVTVQFNSGSTTEGVYFQFK